VSGLPEEAEKVLATAPDEFVARRDALVEELRAAGRAEDAAALADIRKPTAVVLAVNRAARDRPQVARDAADAALRVREVQLSGEPDAYRAAWRELESSLDMLAEVAIAHVAPRGKAPTDAMRRRVHDLLRSAIADDDGRAALLRGVLTGEKEAAGFTSFAGIAPKPARRRTPKPAAEPRPSDRQRAREKRLREELATAKRELRAAEDAVRKAERERASAEKAVAAARAALDELR
jgi:hypothetical protein